MYMRGLDARKAARRPGAESSVALRKRRAWFVDGVPEASGEQQPSGEPDNIDALPSWAQQLIKDVRAEAAQHRVKAKQEADARNAAEAAALAEQGRYKELYEKITPEMARLQQAAERAAALETKIQATNEARIKRIPQQWHSAIPTGYSPEALSEWLDANEVLFIKKPAPSLDGGEQGDKTSKPVQLTELQRQMAAKAGMSPEEYAKFLQKRQDAANLPGKLLGG